MNKMFSWLFGVWGPFFYVPLVIPAITSLQQQCWLWAAGGCCGAAELGPEAGRVASQRQPRAPVPGEAALEEDSLTKNPKQC